MLDGKPANQLSTAPSLSTVQIDSWWYVPSQDKIAVKQALSSLGLLSITITGVPEMLFYSSGVLDVKRFTKNGMESGDHAITLVGWGVDRLPDGTQAKHWIVRNSWG
jgi:C1A family cysteine protease